MNVITKTMTTQDLYIAAFVYDSERIITLLAASKIDVNAKNEDGATALFT